MQHSEPDKTTGRDLPSITRHIQARLSGMHPAYFALSMATGITAIGCHLLGLNEFAAALSWVNFLSYPALWILFLARLVLYRNQVVADCTNHQRAPGFFTAVAATSVLGVQAVLFLGNPALAKLLWWFCVVLWALCTYGVFTALVVLKEKPSLAKGINGGWLVAVVATQSVCVLGCVLDTTLLIDRDTTLFLLTSFWLCGAMLYFWIISLIFYRYMFFRFSPSDLMPPYWINMGAVAISTLAGALLAKAAQHSAFLAALHPYILGMSVMFWATATWWIPMLVVLGIWRHLIRRFPITYDPLYWGLVFPLGMYAVCTFRLAEVLQMQFLLGIARFFIMAAAVAWFLTFLGLSRRLLFAVLLAGRHLWRSRPELPSLSESKPIGGEPHGYQ